jgi:hypothetical protein
MRNGKLEERRIQFRNPPQSGEPKGVRLDSGRAGAGWLQRDKFTLCAPDPSHPVIQAKKYRPSRGDTVSKVQAMAE